jgi:hypothetical protein
MGMATHGDMHAGHDDGKLTHPIYVFASMQRPSHDPPHQTDLTRNGMLVKNFGDQMNPSLVSSTNIQAVHHA